MITNHIEQIRLDKLITATECPLAATAVRKKAVMIQIESRIKLRVAVYAKTEKRRQPEGVVK